MSSDDRPNRSPTHVAQSHAHGLMVEDVFVLADLRALEIPWLNALVERCVSHDDVVRLTTILRSWGPTAGEVERAATRGGSVLPGVDDGIARLRALVRALEPKWYTE